MKNIAWILTILICNANIALSQDKIKEATCLEENNIKPDDVPNVLRITDAEEGVWKIAVGQLEGNDPDKRYGLFNTHNKSTTLPKMAGSELVFSLGEPLKGVTNKFIFYQLKDIKQNKCFDYLVKVSKSDHADVGKSNYKPLHLPPSVVKTKCESCEDKKRIVEYDFSKNELNTYWPNNNIKFLRNRFWSGLPWVGREFSFRVINVNPFRYDIAIADEPVNFYPGTTPLITQAFTAPAVAAGVEPEDNKLKELKDAMGQFKDQLEAKIIELRDAGDCLNPCDTVQAVNKKILNFFRQYGYNGVESLETFLVRGLDLNKEPKDEEKVAYDGYKATIKTYITFRSTGSGTVYYHIPQTQNVDQYLFTLNITPKEGVFGGARVINQPVLVDVLGGFRIDASTGLFFTGLLDNKYSLRTDSTLSGTAYLKSKTIVKETGNRKDFGVSSLLHFYPKLTKFVNIGWSLGAGVTLNDKPKLRYLTGASLLFGKGNRVSITGGLAFGYVDRLSDKYPNGGTANFSETSVPMKKIFAYNYFFSVSYNIPLGKTKEAVKPADSSDNKDDSDDQKDDTNDDKADTDSGDKKGDKDPKAKKPK